MFKMILFTRRNLMMLAGAGFLAAAQLAAQAGPTHFNDANQLITDLASNPLNVNVYDADGSLEDRIDWTGSPRAAISVCGTFITMLMKHTYALSNAQFTARTGSTSPNAAKWHDAIVASSGFQRITAVDAMLPGDVIAIKYPAGENSSGHAMMVQAVSALQQRWQSTQTFLQNGAEPDITGYYDVTVIDSSASFHGSTDSRASKPGGIGRDGIYRVYVNAQGQITGYTWSTVNNSAYKKTSAGYTTAMGRIIPAIW
jgi:hypothetical protein